MVTAAGLKRAACHVWPVVILGFVAFVTSFGAHVVAERAFPDHHRYRRSDLAGLAADAALWVTTEKDAGKLLPSWLDGVEMRVLGLSTDFPRGEAFLDWLEEKLHAHAGGRDATLPPRP